MFCPHCGGKLPDGAASCPGCGRAASSVAWRGGGQTTVLTPPPPPGTSGVGPADATIAGTGIGFPGTADGATTLRPGEGAAVPGSPLAPGTAFGTRYHIIRLLGIGGMGAVYQAWDDALGVAVALKVIRPEITADPAAARDLERRFKRELLLARQVTHKNVVRIHDLGEIDGIKYLTMPYIQGSDLASVLAHEGKLPVRRAVAIARQVVSGLVAAHEAGVVHRDLKPANIMIDADDQAVIMDFGIARSVSAGATVAGAVVGTLEYMAPEQAMAQPVDHRADIYALGLILYDLVLGPRHASRAESAVAELMARVQKPLTPARTIDAAVPEALERIIDRCTQPDPAARYQTTAQLAQDLDLLDASGRQASGTGVLSAPPVTRTHEVPVQPYRRAVPLPAVIAAAAVLVLVAGGWLLRDNLFGGAREGAPADRAVALAFLPFRNVSGDPDLDWLGNALPEMLRTEVGQSAQLRPVPSDRVFQILKDLAVRPGSQLDTATIRRVGEFSSADMLVVGQYVKVGTQVRIDATIHDSRRPEPVVLKAAAAEESALLTAVSDLSRSIRENLALAPADIGEVEATALKPSSSSVPALRRYTEALQWTRDGQHLEAAKSFEAAVREDGRFALAHARLAQTYLNLGYEAEAQKASQQALELSAELPPAERYLIAGLHARVVKDPATAIDSYEKLLGILPENDDALLDLAAVYHQTGALDKSAELYQRILAHDPKHMGALLALGRVEIKRGEAQKGLDYLNQAHSQAIQVGNDEGRATVLYALGIAYRLLNRLDDALRHSQQGLEIRRRLGQKRDTAESLLEIARTQQALGKLDLASAAYEESLALRKETGDKVGIGDTLLDLGNLYIERGHYDQALEHYRASLELQREVGNQNYEALLLSNIGGVYFLQGKYDDALTNYQRSLTIRQRLGVAVDIADTLHNLGEAYERRGRYEQALDSYLKALELRRQAGDKRNAALDRYSMGTVFERQGRLGAALASRKEALDTFSELGERNYWLGEMLSGYGSALIQVGRGDEAARFLDEAAAVAADLRNDVLSTQTLLYRGDRALYDGNVRSAKAFFEQALKAAGKTQDPHVELLVRLRVAKAAVAEGKPQAALTVLKELENEADGLGLPYLSAECQLQRGRALLQMRQFTEARAELEAAIEKSTPLGLRIVLAQSHHALAEVFAALKNETRSEQERAEARRLLDEVQKEAQPADVLKRTDLRELAGR